MEHDIKWCRTVFERLLVHLDENGCQNAHHALSLAMQEAQDEGAAAKEPEEEVDQLRLRDNRIAALTEQLKAVMLEKNSANGNLGRAHAELQVLADVVRQARTYLHAHHNENIARCAARVADERNAWDRYREAARTESRQYREGVMRLYGLLGVHSIGPSMIPTMFDAIIERIDHLKKWGPIGPNIHEHVEDFLLKLEWSSPFQANMEVQVNRCPVCGRTKQAGHWEECRLKNLMARMDPKKEEK